MHFSGFPGKAGNGTTAATIALFLGVAARLQRAHFVDVLGRLGVLSRALVRCLHAAGVESEDCRHKRRAFKCTISSAVSEGRVLGGRTWLRIRAVSKVNCTFRVATRYRGAAKKSRGSSARRGIDDAL